MLYSSMWPQSRKFETKSDYRAKALSEQWSRGRMHPLAANEVAAETVDGIVDV